MDNLHSALIEEITRCTLAAKEYMDTPGGQWAGNEIQNDVNTAKTALSEMDVVKMISAYQTLKKVKF